MFRHEDIVARRNTGNRIALGAIGEHLVCADVMMAGHRAHIAAAGSPYDVIADIGSRLVKLQVKAVSFETMKDNGAGVETRCYTWNTGRRSYEGEWSSYNDVDGFALVALDGPFIAYLPVENVPMKISMRRPNTMIERARGAVMRDMAHFPFSRLVEMFDETA